MAEFGDIALEQIYQKSLLIHSRIHLIYLLTLTIISLIFLAVFHLAQLNLVLFVASFQAIIALILQIILLRRPSLIKFVIYGTIQLLFIICFCFYPSGHSSLLPALLSIFAVYSILPLKLRSSFAICVFLSVSQLFALIFFASPLSITQFLATIVIHLWTHFIGFYAYIIRDRISRAIFLRARNAFAAEEKAIQENAKLTELIASSVPQHLVPTFRQRIMQNSSNTYTEKYGQVTVVYGRLIGLEDIFAQCSVQDCARLLNEFSTRINRIAEKNECMRIQSDGILVVSGAPNFREDHAKLAVKFACDVQALVKSFCDSTTADLGFRSGIESGAVICGTIGTNKWHYDVVGMCVDEAINCVRVAAHCGVFLADNAKEQVVDDYNMENYGCYWRILPEKASALPSSLLFPCLRRFSLATIPQAVNRLLQSISSKSDSLHASSALPGRRKRKSENIPLSCNKLDANETKEKSLIDEATLRFRNVKMETAYHSQADQWFIPALAISIFYLVIYAVYHVLVLPRQIATLIMIVMTLAVMFIILLMIYIDYFENFCQFITRTLFGQSIGTLLILTMLFICGIVNTYSCPQNGGSKVDLTSECFVVHFSLYNCVFWMLTTVAFVRFSSFILFLSLIVAFILYSFHVFITHPELYYSYSQYTQSSSVELELLNGLLVFAFLIFLQARRNERILRFDFMSKLKEVEEKSELERTEALNQKMLQNILPHHIAQSFFAKSELYYHLCHSGGVIYISIVLDDKDIDSNMSSLRNIVSTIDQVLAKYSGIEKIKNCQKFYIAAVGIIPETCSNVHDTPSTIGDLLNELTQFALTISAIAASQGIGLNIGIECGSLLSAVISAHNPVYEIVGKACERARTLMEHADCYGIMVSEEIYLALRPRNFNFDSRPIKIDMAITAYVFEESYPVEESDAQSAIDAAEHSQSLNPLGVCFLLIFFLDCLKLCFFLHLKDEVLISWFGKLMFASMNSSFTSEAYSLDIGVEVESDMEWITPEMILSDHRGEYPSTSGIGMSQYIPSSSNPRSEGSLSPERLRNRRMHSGRFMGLMNCSTISDTGQSCNGADRLAAAAFRVDRMLEELNAVAELSSKNDCCPFPTALSMSTRSLRREISSACHTEYDNAESEGLCSDSEILGGRLEQLKKALKQCRASSERRKRRKFWNNFDNGNDADIDSICSSLNVSSIFGNFRWNSVHSIGYDDEYEIASREDLRELARCQMEALSRDIRKNFGDYQLSTFSDIDADA